VDEYESPALEKLTDLRAQVDAVVELFLTGGFRRYPGHRSRREDLSHRQLHHLFRELQLPPRTERLLVYWAGHGRELQNSGLFLLCSDTVLGPKPISSGDAITPGYLGSQLAMCGARDIVLVVDACSAGGGAQAVIQAFRGVVAEQQFTHEPTLTVISAVASGRQADERALSEAFRAVLEDSDEEVVSRSWGPRDRWVSVAEMISALGAQLGSAQSLDSIIAGVPPDNFFPNPRFDPELPDADLERRRGRPALLRADVREHFMLKFRGIDTAGDDGYFFRGRVATLRSIVQWLRTEDSGMFVVTGPPGSGKSALLGRLAVLADASYRKEVDRADPHVVRAADPDTLPDLGAVDVGVHARGKNVLDCVEELAGALRLEPPRGGWRDPEQLVSAVGRTDRRLTVLVDALDEALPEAVGVIAGLLLRPLADLPGVKVLVGTRRRAVEARGFAACDLITVLAPEAGQLLDLDQAVGTTGDIEAYAYKRLTDLEDSPYALVDTDITRQAAHRVARESESVFLMARLFTRVLAGRSDILDLDGPEAREIFRSHDVAEVFAADLARYGTLRQKVTDLLAPLAWALGSGLPKRAIWATAATALTGGARTYTEEDVAWVLANAGAHLIEAGEAGQSVYRLYHQAYADCLRQTVATADRAPVLLYEAVLGTVPRADGHWDWARASPYALKHLPAYALAAGRLEHLVQDTGILPYADPTRMMRALNTPEQQRRSLPRLYLRVWDELRDLTPEDRAAVLQLRAGVDEPDALPQLGTEALLGWRVRWGNGRRTNFHGALVGGPTSAVGAVAIDLDPCSTLTVAAGDAHGSVHLWDGASGELLHTLSTGPAPVVAVEFARISSRFLLAAASDRQVHLWDVLDGLPVGAPCPHPRRVTALAFGTTLDGEPLLATSARDRRIRLWDIDRGVPLQTWSGGGLGTRALALTSLPGIGDVLVAAHTTGGVSTWQIGPSADVHPRLWWRKLPGQLRARCGIAPAELDGRPVVVGRDGIGVRCLDLRTGEPVGDEDEDGAGDGGFASKSIGFIPESIGGVTHDPTAFVTGGPDGKVRLRRGRGPAAGWTGHSDDVRAVAGVRSRSGDTLVVSGSQDGTVRLWNTAVSTTDDHPEHGQSHEDTVTGSDLVALPDGRLLLATGTADGTVWIWDGRTGRRIARCSKVQAKMDVLDAMAYAENSFYRGSLSSGHAESVTAVSWVPATGDRDATLASGDQEGAIQFWSAEGDPLVRHEGSVLALTTTVVGDDGLVAVGRSGTIVLYGSYGERLRPWLDSYIPRRRISAVAFAPQADGTLRLASGDKSGKITLWEHPASRVVEQLRGPGDGSRAHRGPVHSLVAVRDSESSMLVSADENVVRVWNLKSRSIRAELSCGPVRAVTAAATADGRILVAATIGDRTVEIWDALAETRIATVRGFPHPVSTVTMLRDHHGSDAVLLAVGHGRVVHLVELLDVSDRRRWKDTP
jgi:WD40 repeat protein